MVKIFSFLSLFLSILYVVVPLIKLNFFNHFYGFFSIAFSSTCSHPFSILKPIANKRKKLFLSPLRVITILKSKNIYLRLWFELFNAYSRLIFCIVWGVILCLKRILIEIRVLSSFVYYEYLKLSFKTGFNYKIIEFETHTHKFKVKSYFIVNKLGLNASIKAFWHKINFACAYLDGPISYSPLVLDWMMIMYWITYFCI